MRRLLFLEGIVIGAVIFVVLFLVLFGNYGTATLLMANFVAALDKLLGSWLILPPILSWMLMGTVLGAMIYFAIWEAPKLGRREMRTIVLVMAVFFALASLVVWRGYELRLGGWRVVGGNTAAGPEGLQPGTTKQFAGIDFVWIPPGRFRMGSFRHELGHEDDEQAHVTVLSKGFWLGKFEVTQAQWKTVMNNNPSHFPDDTAPVENVSWEDCQAFIDKLNKTAEPGFRLPTEAEWEFACRAGSADAYACGNDATILPAHGWFKDNSRETTHGVGTKTANAWGLYDMHGNVWEWCADFYGPYPWGRVTDPVGPATGERHVLRGGAWTAPAQDCRSARRFVHLEGYFFPKYNLGFRLARDYDPTRVPQKAAPTPPEPEADIMPDREPAQTAPQIINEEIRRAFEKFAEQNRRQQQQTPLPPDFDASEPLIQPAN